MNVKAYVKALTDAELKILSDATHDETKERIVSKARSGMFPPPLSWEALCDRDQRVKAIKSYRDRTGLSLMESRMVLESVWYPEAKDRP